jgi:hypothetical protein
MRRSIEITDAVVNGSMEAIHESAGYPWSETSWCRPISLGRRPLSFHRFPVKAGPPAVGFAQGIGCRSGEHRDRQEPCADDPSDCEGKRTGNGLQRLGRLGRGFDARLARYVRCARDGRWVRGSYRRTATPAGYDDWERRRFDRRRLLHDDPFRSFGHGGLATVHVSRKKREKDIRDRSTSADHLSHLWKLRTASCGTGACHHVWSELPSTSC